MVGVRVCAYCLRVLYACMASRGSCLLVTNITIHLIAGLAFTARDVYAYGVLIYEVYVEEKAMWGREKNKRERRAYLVFVCRLPCVVLCYVHVCC